MNMPNNKRKKRSQDKIEKVFLELIQTKEIEEISVTDICEIAGFNRSTFYANYMDLYDLVDKIKEKMMKDFYEVYQEEMRKKTHSYNFLKLFQHIKENQLFYKTYFKLKLDLSESIKLIDEKEVLRFDRSIQDIEYHITFFEAGLNAIINKWLEEGCNKTPSEMEKIIKREYQNVKIDT